MSTNKKFRIQNGVDITGEVVVGNQLVITAEGKLVLPAITEAVNEAVASDLAALQAQVDAILGTSPEHLDTLQEIVALFQSEDGDISTLITNNSTAITQIQQTLASGVATAAQGALADTAAQQADLDAAIAAIPSADLTPYSTTAQMDSSIATAKSEAQTYADQVVAATVDAAPAALDTLNELAAALGDDENFASTVTTSIATKADAAATTAALDSKVDSLKSFTVTGDGITSGTPLTMNTDGTLSKAISGTIASWSKSESDILTGKYSQYIGQESNTKARVGLKTFDNDQKFFLLREGLNEVSLIVGEFDSEGEPQELSSSIFPWRDYYTMATGYTPHSSTQWGAQHTIYTYAFNETSGKGIALFGHTINDALIAVGFTVVNDTVIWGSASSAKELTVQPTAGICVSDLQVWSNGYWANDDRVTPGSGTDPWGGSDFIFHAGEKYGNATGIVGLKISTTGVVSQSFHRGRSPVAWQYTNNDIEAIMLGGMNHFDNTYYIVKTSQDASKYNVIVFDMDQYSTQQSPLFDDPQATYLEFDADIVTGTAFDSTTGNMLVHYYAGGDERLAAYNSGVLVSDTVINSNVGTPPTVLAMTENQRSIEVSDDGLIITSRRENPAATYNNGSNQWQYSIGKLHIETWSSDTSTTPVDSYEVIRPGFTSTTDAGAFWGIKKSNGSIFGLSYRFNHNSTPNGQGHDYNPSSWPSFSFTKSVAQIDSTKYIGIASETPSNYEVSVVISGGISSGHTGLIPSSIYYVQTDGSLGTTQTSLKAGVAISATEIKVSDNLSDALTDLSSYATKEYADQAAAGVDLSTYATTAQMDSAIAAIPATDLTPYSTTAQMDSAIAAIPATDLTPYSTTAQMDSSIATAKSEAQTYADQVVAATVDAAPATLDTLNELAAALGDDANFAATVTASLATKADDAATTAALADKVGLAEVDIRMEPIKQLAESAIQAEDFGSGISLSSQTLVDWSSDSVLQTPATIAAPSSVTSDAWAYGTIVANNSTKWATNDWLHDGDKGRVYVFNQSDNSLAFTLDGTSSGERMGSLAIIMNDEYIVAGSYNYNGEQGRVHVFSAVDGSPLYILEPDNVPNPWNQFKGRFGGRGLALEGSNLYVGSTEHITIGDGNVDGQYEAGAVYHFDLSTGNKVYRIENPIAEGYGSNNWFGKEISVHGNNVYVSYGSTHGGLHHYTLSGSTLTLQNSFAFGGISGLGDGANSQFGQQTDTNGTYFIAYAPMNQGSSGDFGVIVYKNEDLHNSVFEPIYNIDTTNAGYGGLLFIDGNVIAAGVGSSDSIQIYTLGDTLSEVVTGQTLSAGNIFSREGTDGGAKPFAYLSGSSKFIYRTEQSSTDIGMYDVVSSSTSSYIVDASVFATKDYVDSGVAGVDLSGYSTTAEMDSAIAAIPATDLTPYSTTAQMDAAIAVETGARETAVTSAISTASADATAKADAAQAAAIAAAGTAATQAIADTIDAAPASLDTLNELAAALGDDANFAATVTASLATKADDAATTAALADKADDAATTAALADKVGLAEVDIRMEPIKQLAESAIQAEDFGTGITQVSTTVADWSLLTSADFAAISDPDEIYTKTDDVKVVDATDTHFVTLLMSNIPGDTSDTYRELTINVHLLDGTLVKSFQATEDYPELNYSWLSYLSVNGNYISLSRCAATGDDTGTGAYSKIYDIRNIAQADHGLVKTINEDNLRRLFTIDDTRAIAVYGGTYQAIDTVKVHNISDWSELYSFDTPGVPDETDFGGGYFVTGGVTGNTNAGITILSTSGSYGLAGIVYNELWHGPTNNTIMFANGITVNDKYVVFRTQETDGTNRAHVHNPVDGSYIRSFVEDSNNPWQVLNNTQGLGKAALALSGDVLFVPLGDYNSGTQQLKKGIAIYSILTGELLNEVTVFDGPRYSGGSEAENLYNVYTVGGSTIIDMNEETADGGSISPLIAAAPTSSTSSYGVDASVFASKDYVDSGVTGNESRLTIAENNLTALEADLSSEENARGAGDAALGLRLDSDKSELDTAIGTLGARLDSDKSELGAAIDAAIEQEVQTPLDLEIGRGSKSLRVGRNTVANTDGGIAIGDAANAAGAKSIALGTSATPTGDNGIEIKTSEAGTLSYSSDSDWSFGAPVTAPSFIGDGSGLTGISSDVTSAIAAEETRATSAESGLQTQISNILSNTDSAALNSLAEIVTEFQNADSTLSGVIGGHGTRLTDLEGRTTDNIPEGITNKYYSDELVKATLSGGLCINDTKLQATGEIAVDEVEAEQSLRVAEAVVSDDTTKLEGQDGSHYRIDIYDVNGTIVN